MKVLILGANGFGRLHLNSWSRMGVDIEVFGRNRIALEESAAMYGVKKLYNTLAEALNSDADIFDIVLPHNLHMDIALKAMQKKKHVLIEKPLATEINDGMKMIEEGERQKVKFMVAEQYYFDSTSVWLRKAVASGQIGRLQTIIIRDQRLYSNHGWRTKKESMGGGALIDGGIHFVDTILNLGGDYEGLKSYVTKGSSTLEEMDTTMCLFAFRGGGKGFLFYCWSYPQPPRVPGFEIIGSEGSIVEDLSTKPQVDFKYMKGKRYAFGLPVLNGRAVELEVKDAFDEEIGGFLKSVQNDAPVPMDPSIALRDLRAVKDIYVSSGT